jgi:hypothetical protein
VEAELAEARERGEQEPAEKEAALAEIERLRRLLEARSPR